MPYSPFTQDRGSDYMHQAFRGGGGRMSIGQGNQQQSQNKAREAQAKEQDKAKAEEVKGLRKILQGHGMSKGEAESMSIGEAKGTLDSWAQKRAAELDKERNDQQAKEFDYRVKQVQARQAKDDETAKAVVADEVKQRSAWDAAFQEVGMWDAGNALGADAGGPGREEAAARGFLREGGNPAHINRVAEAFQAQKQDQGVRFFRGPDGQTLMQGSGIQQLKTATEKPSGSFETSDEAYEAGQAYAEANHIDPNRVRTSLDKNGFHSYQIGRGTPDKAAVDEAARLLKIATKEAASPTGYFGGSNAESILAAKQNANTAAKVAFLKPPFPEAEKNGTPAPAKPTVTPKSLFSIDGPKK